MNKRFINQRQIFSASATFFIYVRKKKNQTFLFLTNNFYTLHCFYYFCIPENLITEKLNLDQLENTLGKNIKMSVSFTLKILFFNLNMIAPSD